MIEDLNDYHSNNHFMQEMEIKQKISFFTTKQLDNETIETVVSRKKYQQ